MKKKIEDKTNTDVEDAMSDAPTVESLPSKHSKAATYLKDGSGRMLSISENSQERSELSKMGRSQILPHARSEFQEIPENSSVSVLCRDHLKWPFLAGECKSRIVRNNTLSGEEKVLGHILVKQNHRCRC